MRLITADRQGLPHSAQIPPRNDRGRILAKVKTSRKNGKPPITRHPLFPATVALWFGALFGIGSLAIRPSLIEAMIVALKIDAVIPAAAPPVGATGHTLIALVFAGLGGLLGARLARRIARPKPVVAERKRGAGRIRTAPPAHEHSAQPVAHRNRLAINDEPAPYRDYVEPAPLPGGANILDVSQFDLEGFEASIPGRQDMSHGLDIPDPVDAAAYAAPWSPEPEEDAPAEHLTGALWRSEPASPNIREGAQIFQPEVAEPVPTEASHTAPAFEGVMPDQAATPRFPAASDGEPVRFDEPARSQADGSGPFARPAAPEAAPQDTLAAHNPPFANAPIADIEEPEAAPLARIDDETEGQFEPIAPRVRPGSIFDQKPAQALFAQPLQASVSSIAWDAGALEQAGKNTSVAPQDTPQDAPLSAAEVPAPDTETASERIASAPLDDLSHVELLERLALTMRRKRQQAVPAEHTAPEQVTQPVPAMPSGDSTFAAQPEYDVPPPPPIPVIPAALRPVGLGDDEDDDVGDLLPVFVPPRHFGQARDGGAAPADQHPATAQNTGDGRQLPEPMRADETVNAPGDELDEGYSSLLSLSRPAAGTQRFVRIEEPQPASAEIEPTVVFPGKEPGGAEGPFVRPAASSATSAPEQSLHDDEPANTGNDSAFQASASRPDPEETDRALRAALANIQRMSGAA
jgi:hypothetical protein